MTNDIGELVADAARDGVQQLVVGAVIEDGGRVLLLRRPGDDLMGGIWELPSGKVEAGETLEEAVVREVEEETGLRVAGVGCHIDSFDYRSGSGKLSRQFNFAVECDAVEPVRLTEHTAYSWTALGDDAPVTDAVARTLTGYRAR